MSQGKSPKYLAAAAHLMAWAAFLFLALWPSIYSGTTTEMGPGGIPHVVPFSGSLVEVNGWWVLVPVGVPLVLTAAGLLAAFNAGNQPVRRALTWLAAALLAGFCIVSGFSIGMFYVPAALALVAAAILLTVARRQDARPTQALHHQ